MIETITIRTNAHGVIAMLQSDNDLTFGLEGVGDNLTEALYDLAETIEEVISNDLIAGDVRGDTD
jgi:hypothetical protein